MNPIILAIIVVGAIGLISGLVLAVASIIMAVKENEKVSILCAELPGANCGACGFSGCDGYAEALANGEANPGLCTPGGADVNNRLGEILGVNVIIEKPKAAVVLCNGTHDNVDNKMFYSGVQTCNAVNKFYNGTKFCSYACLGLGDCVKVCQYGAIEVKNGRAYIDKSKCTACGACVKTCPKGIIELLPTDMKEIVICSNRDKGAVARKACKVACIACGKCVKACEYDAVVVENNLSRINPEKCVRCGACVEACPTKCIQIIEN